MADAVEDIGNTTDIVDENSVATSENTINLDDAAELLDDGEQAAHEAAADGANAPDADVAEDELILGEDGETDAEPDDGEEGLVELTIDGETQRITLDELKQGYSRQQDYTRKTQDLARQQETLQSQYEQAAREVENHRQQAQAYVQLVSELGPQPVPPDPAMLDRTSGAYDPETYRTLKNRYDSASVAWNEKAGKLDQINRWYQEQQAQTYRAWEADQQARLREAWPEVGDQDKLPQIENRYAEFLSDRGFTVEEIAMIKDHRLQLLVRDAMRYDILQANKSAAKAKVRGVPRVQAPGAKAEAGSETAERRAAILERAGKRGAMSIDDAAAFLSTGAD